MAAAIENLETVNTAKAWLSRLLGRRGDIADLPAKESLAKDAAAYFSLTVEPHGVVVSTVASAEASAALGDHGQASMLFGEAITKARDLDSPALEALACQAYGNYLEGEDAALAQVMLERSRWARSKFR